MECLSINIYSLTTADVKYPIILLREVPMYGKVAVGGGFSGPDLQHAARALSCMLETQPPGGVPATIGIPGETDALTPPKQIPKYPGVPFLLTERDANE